jgi:hypothetical protein
MKYPVGTKVYYINADKVKKYGVVVPDEYQVSMEKYYTWVHWDIENETLWIRDKDLYSDVNINSNIADKWEYKLVPMNSIDNKESFEVFLNKYGEEGWELTCSEHGKYIFKRKKI